MSKGFTLIELLVVIAIIAILAVVVVLTLNPAQLLAQSRDANRVSDISTLNTALNLYVTDQSSALSLGNSSTSYMSIPDSSGSCANLGMPPSSFSYGCVPTSTYRMASSTGWIPVNFAKITAGSPVSILPVDPVGQTSTNLFYTYEASSSQYELTAFMESQKYAKTMANAGGIDPTLLEIGSGATALTNWGRGLVGYWPLDDGSGGPTDWSGYGDNMTLNGSTPTYVQGKVGTYAVNLPNNTSIRTGATLANSPSQALTAIGWVNYPSGQLFSSAFEVARDSLWAQTSTWDLNVNVFSNNINAQIVDGSHTTQSAICTGAGVPNAWQQIAMTYDGSNIIAYLNGVQCATKAAVGVVFLPHAIWSVGNVSSTGSVDDLRVYNRVLSANEIQEIYNAEK